MGEYANDVMRGFLRAPRSIGAPAPPGSALARARCEAHAAFDYLWKSGRFSRSQAYVWLAEQMDLPRSRAHISMFDTEQCGRVVRLCAALDFEVVE